MNKYVALLASLISLITFSAFAQEPLYCNGQPMYKNGSLLYPNGQRVSYNYDVFFPNGQVVIKNMEIYYPNGQRTIKNMDQYYMNGTRVNDGWSVKYPNGQFVMRNNQCYTQNGVPMPQCPGVIPYVERWEKFKLTGDLIPSLGYRGTFKIEYVDGNVTTYLTFSPFAGVIENIYAICE